MRVAIIFVILCTAVIAQGQTPLEEMVRTEQAFSKMAEEKTTREAFLAFIADDGLLFRPGAVNGKKWLLEHPLLSVHGARTKQQAVVGNERHERLARVLVRGHLRKRLLRLHHLLERRLRLCNRRDTQN